MSHHCGIDTVLSAPSAKRAERKSRHHGEDWDVRNTFLHIPTGLLSAQPLTRCSASWPSLVKLRFQPERRPEEPARLRVAESVAVVMNRHPDDTTAGCANAESEQVETVWYEPPPDCDFDAYQTAAAWAVACDMPQQPAEVWLNLLQGMWFDRRCVHYSVCGTEVAVCSGEEAAGKVYKIRVSENDVLWGRAGQYSVDKHKSNCEFVVWNHQGGKRGFVWVRYYSPMWEDNDESNKDLDTHDVTLGAVATTSDS
mmetsp:Transcript_49206/g.129898  ORF Transcript_49206/g.129898 Transcript_49206/m.129898 type:complete len:254 (-) Transcript_49206:82-843(-)